MNVTDFLKLVPVAQQAKSLQSTLDLWCHIYTFIEQNGSADTADDEQFLDHVRQQKSLTASAIAGHLRKMASLGLIEAHKLILGKGKRNSFPFGMMPMMGEALPTHIMRYTLPGKEPPLQVRRAKTNVDQLANSFKSLTDLPEAMEDLDDVERLHSWLEDLYENRERVMKGSVLEK
jgi:hypothetical protein